MDAKKLLELVTPTRQITYSRRDARLYALSLGFGTHPLFEPELDYVTDRASFKVVPSMASIFAPVILDLTEACNLVHPELALHGQQKLRLFKPLPDEATLEVTGSIPEIFDRGEQRGAEIHMLAEARLAGEPDVLYRATYVTIARGDGGFGGLSPGSRGKHNPIPGDEPDYVLTCNPSPNQALWYALNGDPNPIHTQPVIAKKAGFDVPILHGLCTYGMACRALIATCLNYKSDSIRQFDARFSAPVIPGDELRFEFWQSGDEIRFQTLSASSSTPVLKDGYCKTG